MADRYWLTPNGIYTKLDEEFHFDFDPCPYPKPEGYNSLIVEWGKSNYVNPPFRKTEGNIDGPTAFVRKAIEEQQNGNASVLTLPIPSYVNLMLNAGAEVRSLGRVRWLEVETKEPWKAPVPIACFILRGK